MTQTGYEVRGRPRGKNSFTLIEVMVSMSILTLIILVIASAMNQTREVWTSSRARVEAFRETRAAFEAMARRLSEASVNAYWGYDDPANPSIYLRQSDLHFVTGVSEELMTGPRFSGHCVFFQAPFGYAGTEAGTFGRGEELDHMESLLNGWGYYVSYGSDFAERPAFLQADTDSHPERNRLRLFEFREPSEMMRLFEIDPGSPLQEPKLGRYTSRDDINSWFRNSRGRNSLARPIADNILALVISPRAPTYAGGRSIDYNIAPDYNYDTRLYQWDPGSPLAKETRHQLPPTVHLTLVATTEASWVRFEDREGEAGAFEVIDFMNSRFKSVPDFEDDLDMVEEFLHERGLEYRVFTTAVALRAAKWISDEE